MSVLLKKLFFSEGIVLGIITFFSFGNFLIIALSLLIFYNLYLRVSKEDRTFIIKASIVGFALRVLIIFLYYYFYLLSGHADILGPDGESYSQHGWYISRLLVGDDLYRVPNNLENIFAKAGHYRDMVEYYKHEFPPMGYQNDIFTYLIGVLYAFLGYSPLIVRLLNSTCSILTGIIVYFIGRDIFTSRVGKVSMLSFIFLPSVIIYSITALRDTIVIFLITLAMWLMVGFVRSKNYFLPIIAFILSIAAGLLRNAIKYPLIYLIAALVLFNLRIGIFKKWFIMFVITIIIFSVSPLRHKIQSYLNPDIFFSVHIGYVNTRGNNYMIFPERCYQGSRLIGLSPIEIMTGFAKGAFHLFSEPLPARCDSLFLLLAGLQTFLLYLLIPFILIGIVTGLQHRFYYVMPIVAYLLIFTLIMSISEGNVGTVFRHRDMLMPFLSILGIVGLYAKLGRKSPL